MCAHFSAYRPSTYSSKNVQSLETMHKYPMMDLTPLNYVTCADLLPRIPPKKLKVDLLTPKLSYSKDIKKLAFLYYFRAFSFLINGQYFLKYVTN